MDDTYNHRIYVVCEACKECSGVGIVLPCTEPGPAWNIRRTSNVYAWDKPMLGGVLNGPPKSGSINASHTHTYTLECRRR